MRTLGRGASFWTAGAVVALALWASCSPTMVYPLYQAEWGMSTTMVTWTFAAYAIVLIPVLLLFGNVSDYIGRRVSMLLGLIAELIGVLLFVFARDVAWLLIGRAFIGLGVGLSIGPAGVAMVEYSAPEKKSRAGAMTTAISAVGIGLSMLVGGALTEYAPLPLRLSFVVLAVATAVVAVLVFAMPRHTAGEAAGRWRVSAIVIPQGSRAVFVAGALSFASAFLIGAIVLPLGARIGGQLAGSTSALVTGSLLAVFAAGVLVFSLLARRVRTWVLVIVGTSGALVTVWLFVATGLAHSLLVFLASTVVAGASYAFAYSGGLSVFNAYASPHHRASMVSGGFLIGYAAQGVGSPFIGAITTAHGLMTGLVVGASAFGAFFIAALVMGSIVAGRMRRRRSH